MKDRDAKRKKRDEDKWSPPIDELKAKDRSNKSDKKSQFAGEVGVMYPQTEDSQNFWQRVRNGVKNLWDKFRHRTK